MKRLINNAISILEVYIDMVKASNEIKVKNIEKVEKAQILLMEFYSDNS